MDYLLAETCVFHRGDALGANRQHRLGADIHPCSADLHTAQLATGSTIGLQQYDVDVRAFGGYPMSGN
jgi:hypothetical protein